MEFEREREAIFPDDCHSGVCDWVYIYRNRKQARRTATVGNKQLNFNFQKLKKTTKQIQTTDYILHIRNTSHYRRFVKELRTLTILKSILSNAFQDRGD